MRSRRIVLSDDEDGDGVEYVLPAPPSSSDLVQGLHGLNVEGAGTRMQRTTHPEPPSSATEEAYWQAGDVQFSQADGNLDAESTVKVMHGRGHSDDEEEEFDFEDEDKPKPKPKPKHLSGQGRETKRKPPAVPASGRPRRAAAARAEEQLHQLYSEHDMRGTPQQENGDGSFSDDSGSGSGEPSTGSAASSHRHAGGGETQDGDDSASDVLPRRRRSASGTNSEPSSGGKKLHAGSARRRDASPPPATAGASRRQSARSVSLSSRKEQQYQKARNDMKLKASGGLDAVLQSSSDSGEGEGGRYSDGSEVDFIEGSPPRGSSSGARARRQEAYSPTEPSRYSGAGSGGRRNEPRTRYSFSVSKNRSPKAAAKGFAHWRDEREADLDAAGDSEESDINDFIVNSDEERAEEEERAAAAAQRREQRRQQRKADRRSSGSRAKDVIAAATARYERSAAVAPMDSEEEDTAPARGNSRKSGTKERRSAAADAGTGSSRKRRLVVASSDEDERGDGAEQGRKRRHAGGGAGVVDLTGDGEDEMEEGSGEEGSAGSAEEHQSSEGDDGSYGTEGSDGSEGSDSELDGPMLYYKVNSMLEQRQGRGEEIATIASMRKHFPVAEAVQYYVQLLANVLVDPDFLDDCLRYRSGAGAGAGGRHGSGKRDRARQKEDREAVERASNYLSASRQIENLLCTARESLLGSGAWNKEFYSELQARPFYQSISTAMCIGSSGGGGSGRKGRKRDDFDEYRYGDEGASSAEEEEPTKCAACNRSTQQPDIQVFLFGSRYDARSVWDTERWDRHMPEELFLYPAEQEEKGYMHEAGSNINSPRYGSPRSASGPSSGSGTGHHRSLPLSVRRNKQFQGYQTLMSSGLKRDGDTYTVRGGGGSGAKGRLQPDETLVGSWQARQARLAQETRQAASEGGVKAPAVTLDSAGDKAGGHHHAEARKRKLIVLSDSEDEDQVGQQGEEGSHHQGGGKRSRGQTSPEDEEETVVQDRIDCETEQAEAEAEAEAERVRQEQQELELAEEEDRVRSWWKQKFPREFTREPESVYFLSIHCKNRTRMYHTLLHYKFRLLLTIRAKLLRTANALAGTCRDGVYDDDGYGRRVSQSSSSSHSGAQRSQWRGSGGDSQFDTSWEQWDPDDRATLLQAALAQLEEDEVFLDQEARRFQALVKETERRYGGGDEPRHDIWGDEDDSAGATGSGAAKPSQQSQTILNWLNKQKVKAKPSQRRGK